MPRCRHIDEIKPNLYLLGFMGTGKTAVGKRVAKRLKYTFLDSDAEIEKRCGMEVSQIFATKGEDEFRKLEREFIESGHPDQACVIACGGGMVCREGMPELLKSKGVCVVLFSTPEEILERVSRNNKRPLLQNVPDKLQHIKNLLEQRNPYYIKSGITISAGANIKHTENRVLRIYTAIKRRKNGLSSTR